MLIHTNGLKIFVTYGIPKTKKLSLNVEDGLFSSIIITLEIMKDYY